MNRINQRTSLKVAVSNGFGDTLRLSLANGFGDTFTFSLANGFGDTFTLSLDEYRWSDVEHKESAIAACKYSSSKYCTTALLLFAEAMSWAD